MCLNRKDMSRRVTSVVMMSLLLLMTGVSGYGRTTQNTGTVLTRFLDPDVHAKPMARMWFPDAGAGEDNDDYIDKQISELAKMGFGGVEVAMLMSYGVHYGNEEAQTYGWGTDNWIKLLKKVLKSAARVPGGFQVDMTVTAHWPPMLNTFDPNDDASNKELSFSVTPITSDNLVRGTIKLELPLQRKNAPASTFGPESEGPWTRCNGKQDDRHNRKRMAD